MPAKPYISHRPHTGAGETSGLRRSGSGVALGEVPVSRKGRKNKRTGVCDFKDSQRKDRGDGRAHIFEE